MNFDLLSGISSRVAIMLGMVLMVSICSCKKEETPLTVSEKLIETEKWKLSEIQVDGEVKTDSLLGDSCQNFELFKLQIDFKSDKTFFVDNSTIVCSGDTLTSEDGVWSVSDNQKEFVMLSSFQNVNEFSVVESSLDKFVISQRDTSGILWKVYYVKR